MFFGSSGTHVFFDIVVQLMYDFVILYDESKESNSWLSLNW